MINFKYTLRALSLFMLFSLFCACTPEQNTNHQSRSKIKAIATKEHPQEIVVVTHAGPNTYYLNADNQYAGIEYDLANLFSEKFAPEYKIKFLVVHKDSDVLPTLLSGKADIAAAGLAITPAREQKVAFATPYFQSQQKLVFNHILNKKPKDLSVIPGAKFVVPAESNFSERLAQLTTQYPSLNWQEDRVNNSEILLTKVANGQLDYTIANNQLINLMQNYYPNLQEGQAIGKPEKTAWAFAPDADEALVKKVNLFFSTIKKDGTLRNLLDRYYGHSERLDSTDITYFLKRVDTILPKYKRLFKQAEAQTGLNWRLLAALSFRESHWDPENTSPTNVRGLMMLTEDTASALGVTDRLDPEQSIPAGAKYILQMKALFPKTIPDPDRTYFALASYNIGYAHVQDARKLARRLKLNQDSWADIKKTLVLLNQPEYYTTLKYGYASGGAPVIFVETIRSYQRILEKYQPSPAQVLSGYYVAVR